jgi:hypothetical protein
MFILTGTIQGRYFLMKRSRNCDFYIDVTIDRVHHDYGSKRFERQRAWREVADLER